MINSQIRFKTIIVLFTLAAMSAASVYVFQNEVSAAGFQGKIDTATFDGQPERNFSGNDAVYLTGGPQNQNHALPDGTYYFQVTDPSGNTLLSTDAAICRQVIVFSGRIVAADGPSCQHPTGIPESAADGSTPIKLAPFSNTPNPGKVHKVWLIRQGAGTTVAADGKHINFSNSNAKSETFKVNPAVCANCGPTSLLAGRKFYDANANAVFDQGEVTIEGVQILILAGDTTTIVTTNGAGSWSTTVPAGVEYTVLEFLPFTGAGGEPGSYWRQTAPAADGEGFQGYVGTASSDQTNLNFGNICFNLDAGGNRSHPRRRAASAMCRRQTRSRPRRRHLAPIAAQPRY